MATDSFHRFLSFASVVFCPFFSSCFSIWSFFFSSFIFLRPKERGKRDARRKRKQEKTNGWKRQIKKGSLSHKLPTRRYAWQVVFWGSLCEPFFIDDFFLMNQTITTASQRPTAITNARSPKPKGACGRRLWRWSWALVSGKKKKMKKMKLKQKDKTKDS